jgi:hypothetical protein
LVFGETNGTLAGGFRLLYNLRFSEARMIFLEWQRTHPSDPMGFIAEAASNLFEEFERDGVLTTKFFLDDDRLLGGIKGVADPARTQAFERANEKARGLAQSQLSYDPHDSNALFALTLAAGLQADYSSLIAKHQIESLSQIREAEKFAQRLAAVAPAITDVYMALGAANYILACLPPYKRAVLWFGGLEGNKQRGMDQLAQASRDGEYLGPYAKILLAMADLREKRGADAKRLMAELTTEFPESPLFRRERANVDRIAG